MPAFCGGAEREAGAGEQRVEFGFGHGRRHGEVPDARVGSARSMAGFAAAGTIPAGGGCARRRSGG